MKIVKTMSTLANEILSEEAKKIVQYNTEIAERNKCFFFFKEGIDFGIHLLDIDANELIEMKKTDLPQNHHYICDMLKSSGINLDNENMMVAKFLILHEEGHYVDFLKEGITDQEYKEKIMLNYYNIEKDRRAKEIRTSTPERTEQLKIEYVIFYRNIPYEKRADEYSIKKLRELE